ncbi:hypothetical protein DUNSADRAFT_14841 [Dunaliella salina]|uniref:Encoded protein n=1 Tax=Dunaliella salina TaxID=3046 RepID=A0ABQ7H2D6_DUNSA|nr:hypothetical protein DUNSADRAFT_14841 [Dunaliella salina]|eukprot:KAF5840985.1 hypothetical protein DUNSADRAFT_14841 [Dunaliella salina]
MGQEACAQGSFRHNEQSQVWAAAEGNGGLGVASGSTCGLDQSGKEAWRVCFRSGYELGPAAALCGSVMAVKRVCTSLIKDVSQQCLH